MKFQQNYVDFKQHHSVVQNLETWHHTKGLKKGLGGCLLLDSILCVCWFIVWNVITHRKRQIKTKLYFTTSV